MNNEDVLLYGADNKPLLVYDNAPSEGIYFDPFSYENYGKFPPSVVNVPLGSGEVDVSQYDRQRLVRVSRKLYATMPEVAAASSQLATLTVGIGFGSVFTGEEKQDQAWGEIAENTLENSYYKNWTPYGMAYDWRTTWELVSYLVDRDGDMLMVPFLDRKGQLKYEFIESHRIANRPMQETVESGRYVGYNIRDGVVLSDSGYPIGYQVIGANEDEDIIVPTSVGHLIYNPFSFSKYRGLPILKAALKDATSLQQIEDALEMVCIIESKIYLKIKNDTGQAPRTKVKVLGQSTSTPTNPPKKSAGPLYEDFSGGLKYVATKHDIQSFPSQRPADQTMRFLEHLSKGVMLATKLPYQWLLNPESVSGASSRGIKEQITKAVQSRHSFLSKYAIVALQKAVVNGMELGTIPQNYRDDKYGMPVFTNWSLSQSAELMLDSGYEVQSYITAYLTGLISADEILQKYGKRYKKTLAQRKRNVSALLDTVIEMQQEYPDFKAAILNFMQKEDFQMPVLPPEQEQKQ